jgi:hypothetical protein
MENNKNSKDVIICFLIAIVVMMSLLVIVCKNTKSSPDSSEDIDSGLSNSSDDTLNKILNSVSLYDEARKNEPILVANYTSYSDGREDSAVYIEGYNPITNVSYTYSPSLDISLWSLPINEDELESMDYYGEKTPEKILIYYDENSDTLKKYIANFDLNINYTVAEIQSEEYNFNLSDETRVVKDKECYMVKMESVNDLEDNEHKPDVYLLVTKDDLEYIGTLMIGSSYSEYMLIENDMSDTLCKYTVDELHSAVATDYDDYTTYVIDRFSKNNSIDND